jgi:ribosomal protein L12E/L44/L45/RPP1/RPP2
MQDITSIQKIYPDMEELLIKQFFYKAGTKIAASKDLLFWKMDQKFKDGYSIETDFVSEDVRRMTMRSLGFPENAMFIMMRSIVTMKNGRRFTAFATVTANNIKGNKHPIELCETRAELRAIRKATGAGFSCIEDEPVIDGDPNPPPLPVITEAYEDNYRNAFKRLQILVREAELTRDEKLDIYSSVAGRRISSSKELSAYEIGLAIEKIENRSRIANLEPVHIKKVISNWDGQPAPPPPSPEEEITEADYAEFEEVHAAEETPVQTQQGPEMDKLVTEVKDKMLFLEWNEKKTTDFWTWISSQKGRPLTKPEELNLNELELLLDFLNRQASVKEETAIPPR